MSDKYILRSGAIDAIKRNSGTLYTREAEFLLRKVILLLKNAPAADVAEVVQGQWEGEGDGYADGEIVLDVWHCSQCGYCIDDGTDNPKCLPKHCPNCGAKMDGGCENA